MPGCSKLRIFATENSVYYAITANYLYSIITLVIVTFDCHLYRNCSLTLERLCLSYILRVKQRSTTCCFSCTVSAVNTY